MLTLRRTLVIDLAVVDIPQRAVVWRLEGLHGGGVGLGDVARIQHRVVHSHQHPAVGRLRIRRRHHRIIQVERTVGAHRRRRPHRAHKHHRLIALHRQIEEVGRLFQRIGAVGDDEAVGLAAVGVNFLRQRQPDPIVHVLRTDVHHLLPLHVGDIFQRRHRIDQRLDAQLARRIVGFCRRIAAAGNGAAGRQQSDVGQRQRRGAEAGQQEG